MRYIIWEKSLQMSYPRVFLLLGIWIFQILSHILILADIFFIWAHTLNFRHLLMISFSLRHILSLILTFNPSLLIQFIRVEDDSSLDRFYQRNLYHFHFLFPLFMHLRILLNSRRLFLNTIFWLWLIWANWYMIIVIIFEEILMHIHIWTNEYLFSISEPLLPFNAFSFMPLNSQSWHYMSKKTLCHFVVEMSHQTVI
jgi:hypothetical protein